MTAPRYRRWPDGRTETADGEPVSHDDAGLLAYLHAGGAMMMMASPLDEVLAITPAELGRDIVDTYEAALVEAGINSNPKAALALYRYMAEARDALRGGLLHVALAAIEEMLEAPEASRPAGASDQMLGGVVAQLRGYLKI